MALFGAVLAAGPSMASAASQRGAGVLPGAVFPADAGGLRFPAWPIMMYETVRRAPAPEAAGGLFAAAEIGPIGGRSHSRWFTALILMFGAGTGG